MALLAKLVDVRRIGDREAQRERRIVLGEIQHAKNAPSAIAREQLFEHLYPNHAMGLPVRGAPKELQRLTLSDLRAFFERRYRPANRLLVVVGRFDARTVLSGVKNSFQSLPTAPSALPEGTDPAPPPETRTHTRRSIVRQAVVMAGARLDDMDDRQEVELSLAAEMLSQRLFMLVREERGLAYEVSANLRREGSHGLLTTVIGAHGTQSRTVETLIQRETQRLQEEQASVEELAVAKHALLGNLIRRRESPADAAAELGMRYMDQPNDARDDSTYLVEFLNLLARLTPADVQRAAAHARLAERMVISVVKPRGFLRKLFFLFSLPFRAGIG
jgi:predicted Zn-dependent peptidase